MKDDDILLPELTDIKWASYAGRNGINVMQDYAREAVRMNQKQEQAPVSEPRPFSLEAAKRGEPLVTRDGTPVKFIAYVEELPSPVLFLLGGAVHGAEKDGHYGSGVDDLDLFLAPKPKRTVWVNVYKDGEARWSTDKDLAERGYDASMGVKIGRAVPIQIDDVWGEG